MVLHKLEKYYTILSGEHETLPLAEFKSIMEAEGVEYQLLSIYPQVLTFTSNNFNFKVLQRAAMVKEAGILITDFECENLEDIIKASMSIEWNQLLKGRTFLVRFKRIRGSLRNISRSDAEREVGRVIYENTRCRVNVKSPDVLVRGILVEHRVLLGIKCLTISSKDFQLRRPRARVYFHPTALNPKLSRLFVNLSRVKKGDLMLDPFCGTGGILIEAAMIGVNCLGSDVDRDMVKGALLNLRHFSLEPLGVVRADVTLPPWVRVDAIATDPPYGRASSAKGRPLRKLIFDFLLAHYSIVKPKRYIVFALPHDINVDDVIPRELYELVEVHRMRVHKSLTRYIVVVRRK